MPDWPYRFNLSQSKDLLSGPHGLMTPENIGLFLDYCSKNNFSIIQEIWHIDTDQAGKLLVYLTSLATFITDPYLQLVFEKGGGLFTTRSVKLRP